MSNNRYIAGVAGTNAMKVEGTLSGICRLILKRKDIADIVCFSLVRGVKVPDCAFVPSQPFGFMQTRQGALFRAEAVLGADPEAIFGVGIENGVLLNDTTDPGLGGVDVPVVAVVCRLEPGRVTYATGPGVPVEGRYVIDSLATDQHVTCGKLIAKETGLDHADWHKGYTGGLMDREEAIAQAVMTAFAAYFGGH